MAGSLIAALDVGTSRVKGALYEWRGGARAGLVTSLDAALPPLNLSGFRAEQATADVMGGVRKVIGGLVDAAPPQSWSALALATQRGTFVPLDDRGSPLAPLVSWLDRRGLEAGGDRWAWFETHLPDVVKRTQRLSSLMAWLVGSLTDQSLDTPQTATPESARVGTSPALVAPGAIAKVASTDLARALRLPPGLPIVLAGGDKNCELVGAGCVSPGRAVVSFGTAVSLGLLVPAGAPSGAVLRTPAHVRGLEQLEVGLPFGGGVWSWLVSLFGPGATELTAADLGEETPLFIPYLAGSLSDGAARGSWHELTPAATPRALTASGLEGVLHDLRRGRAELPGEIAGVTLVGGGGASPVLAQWLADTLACSVGSTSSHETGLAGAAMTAAVALGLADGADAAWQAAAAALAPPVASVFSPGSAAVARQTRRHTRWLQLLS